MRRLVHRLLSGVVTVACVYVLTFVMVVSLPGNPFQQGQRRMSVETEMAMRARYHMDDTWRYFWEYLAGAVRLDFGPTFAYADWTCNEILAAALPVSMTLGLMAILVALIVGVPLGVFSAMKKHGWIDTGTLAFVLGGISLPTFVTGSLLLILLGVYVPLLPIGGWGTREQLVLPVLTLAWPFAATIARLTRSGMLDALSNDFIRTAVAKGASRSRVVWHHALRVAFLPVLSYLGPAIAHAMTGSFVVEKVFGVPGLGQHFVNAALNRDVGLVMATVSVFAVILVCMNLVVDGLYMLLDPRIASE